MKKLIFYIMLLLAVPLALHTQVPQQYRGGDGGGAFSLQSSVIPLYGSIYEGGKGGGAFSAQSFEAPLPVNLSSFISIVNGRNIKLRWITTSEHNNTGFEIERKVFSGDFAKVGFVVGHGTINAPSDYTFEDINLETGKYSYRLKQIDINGNFEYHNLNGAVIIGIPTKFKISQNYPNPFNPVTKINFDLPVDAKATIKIYDITGREIATLLNNEFRFAGYYTIEFDASKFTSGVYFYRIQAGNLSETKRMILIK